MHRNWDAECVECVYSLRSRRMLRQGMQGSLEKFTDRERKELKVWE